ncbi:MAG: OmpA/MotB protein [bacterium]|nr:MAG: OmpA/MotB protein [bacterium]
MILGLRRILGNEKGEGSFLVLSTTLNMLLLAFFIVLNSIAVIDDKRKLEALGSLLGTLGLLTSGLSPTALNKGDKKMNPQSIEMTAGTDSVMHMLHRMESYAFDEGLGSDVSIQYGSKGITVLLTNRITFAKGGAALQPVAKKMLDSVSRMMSDIKGEINIIAHAEPGSHMGGPYPDEWSLSYARAGAAARYLVKYQDAAPERVAIAGYGFTRPLHKTGMGPKTQQFKDRLELILDRSRI